MSSPAALGRNDVDILGKETLWKGRFQIDRYTLRHKLHGGGWSEAFQRVVFERGHAAAVLPYDPVRDRVVLIEQFRAGAYAAGESPWLIEVVAGIIDPGEQAAGVVKREAWEEARVEVTEIEPIASCFVTPGACSESLDIFVGKVDSAGAGGVFGLAEEHEDIRVFTASTDEAAAMLADGRIRNAVAIIALQWLLLNRMSLRDRWGGFKR
ncbi:MAG: NUDIX domain-containing protein [Rhodospirillaceae bacterium]|nr:NUDIX domain-containing protein [Rhodospirillaceae bacterium]